MNKQKSLKTYMMIHKIIRIVIIESLIIIILGILHFNSILQTVILWTLCIGVPLIFLVKDIYKTYKDKSSKMDTMITLNEYIKNYTFTIKSTDN